MKLMKVNNEWDLIKNFLYKHIYTYIYNFLCIKNLYCNKVKYNLDIFFQ